MTSSARPVPLDYRVLRGLTPSFALDLYVWTTYRMSLLRRPVAIPWEELKRQFGGQERTLRKFRVETRRALERMWVLYPGLQFEVRTNGLWLFPSQCYVGPRVVG